MPELPEVETTRCGIAPHVTGQDVHQVVIRQPRLRWPIPRELPRLLGGRRIEQVRRRAKYLLFDCGHGHLLIHLGMSGSLRIVRADTPPDKHDHLDIVFTNGQALRLHDPRRFGAVLWCEGDPYTHELLASLGPEPLGDGFSADYLYPRLRGRKLAIKQAIMDNKLVVGVGNIYANEALFLAGIRPTTAAGRLSRARVERLVATIRQVLAAAITQGGTTLRDFVGGDGKPGYFAQQLKVYGREGLPCLSCQTPIRQRVQGQRSSWYCPQCQR